MQKNSKKLKKIRFKSKKSYLNKKNLIFFNLLLKIMIFPTLHSLGSTHQEERAVFTGRMPTQPN